MTTLKYGKPKGKTVEYLEQYYVSPLRTGYVTCNDYLFSEYFTSFGDQIYNMDIRPDDIWVCSAPKSGTTLTQEMIWCIANNVDLKAAEAPLSKRFPFLEHSCLFDVRNTIPKEGDAIFQNFAKSSVQSVIDMSSPRFIKTHLPFNLLPQKLQQNETKVKMICVVRNPTDICVSYFHHKKNMGLFTGNFEQFCQMFLEGNIIFTQFWDFVKSYWEFHKERDILILKYEDIKKDLKSVIYKIADFLQKPLNEEQVTKLMDHLSFEKMKENPAINRESLLKFVREYNNAPDNQAKFLRSGKVGEWKEVMSEHQIRQFQEWTRENLKNADESLVKFLDYLL